MTEKKQTFFSVTWLILVFLIICGGGYLFLQSWQTSLQTQKINLEKAIQSLTKEFLLAEIKIQQTTPEISGQVVFFSPTGNSLQSFAFEMMGSDLYIEFLLLSWEYKTHQFVFAYPLRLYSDVIAPSDGVDMLTTFTNNLNMENDAEKLAYALIRNQAPENLTITKTQTIALHQYPGQKWKSTHYEIVYRQNGTIELREK